MPELPEVEVVRAGLEPAVVDAGILHVELHDPRAVTRHARGADDFARRLAGRTMRAAVRRGKFLWFPLDDRGEAITGHLGMSGQMLLRAPDAPPERHERVRLLLAHPRHGELALVFADQRTFGSLAIDDLVPTGDAAAGGYGSSAALVPTQVSHIARDPLDPAFDDAAFYDRLTRSRSAIKRVLLDQSVVSGIGNIYADEALWAAQEHPETPAASLTRRRSERLVAEVRAVLERALAEGGTSFDAQYVNVNGQAGYFAHSLNAYGRGGLPCPRCGTPLARMSFMNRSSHLCPRCQRQG